MAAIIAGKKGHSAVSFFAGLILGVFGVLLAWWQDDLTKAEPPAVHNRLPARDEPPAGTGHQRGAPRERGGSPGCVSARVFEFCSGLVDLVVCVGHHSAVVIVSPLRASDS